MFIATAWSRERAAIPTSPVTARARYTVRAMTTPTALPPPPQRALVVMAHPDDIEFSCGGAVANLTDAGWAVTFCLVTSGDKGTKDRGLPPSELAALREAEQEAAAKVLGVERCLFLRWPDGFVEDTPELRGALVRCIRAVAPDLLITWDPYRGFSHRDHRTVGVLTLDAAFPLARVPHSYPDHQESGLLPHRVNEILLAGTREPDYYVDVAHQLERKIDALRCHASQVGESHDELLQRGRARAATAAAAGEIPWAEGFRRLFFGDRTAPRRADLLAAARSPGAGQSKG